jgi:hypothetical protein
MTVIFLPRSSWWLRHSTSSKRLPENALVMTHSSFCVIISALFLEPVRSPTNSSASATKHFLRACVALQHWSASTCKHPHCNLGFAKSRYYLWRHKHANGKQLASNALLFVALQRHSRKRAHSVRSASVSAALLCGNTPTVTNCSLSRALICGATKHASWKWPVLLSHWGEGGGGRV